jgi:hypothetical protein
MAGGTVTISGGNVIHTFTSSGYLTPLKLVNNSLRFRSSASAYLSRTFSNASTNNKILTYSVWVKRGILSTDDVLVDAYDGSSAAEFQLYFDTSNSLSFTFGGASAFQLTTTAVYRDPSAWYHIVLAIDTTQATASNRVKFYVNGSQVTAFSTANYPSQNATSQFPTLSGNNKIGSNWNSGSGFFDGYMTEINFIDGQALTPNSFGTFNSYGVWQPITYGGSYGTNGFYLPMTASSASLSTSYLVVAGGGGGARGASGYQGGGGGAGGLLAGTFNLSAGSSYAVTIGAGGSGGTGGGNGGAGTGSSISAISTTGGGGGGYNNANAGSAGGSGGGGASSGSGSSAGGAGTAGQGNAGGTGITVNPFGGGGGGGAGAVGSSGATSVGGIGLQSSITGTSTYYAGGGGGYAGAGGLGGGGAGNAPGDAGTANTGGGGGGGPSSFNGGAGGSGVVIVSYAGTQKFVGGSVTGNNGNTIHTFTSSGTLTPIGLDFSPNGNNWTGNNISTTSGSTYDIMTDVPTLTSTTAANYCVFNPLDRGSTNFTLSNGNLNIVGASASSAVRATMGVSSGKWYWEATPTAIGNGLGVGFAGDSSRFNPATWNAGTYVIYQSDGNKHINGSASAYGATYTTSDVIGVALDMDAGTITFYKNNTSQGTASTGLTGVYLPVFSQTSGATTGTINANFGAGSGFTYTPPTNFVALNTFNL